MSTIGNFPGTPDLYINADNVDGFDNELISHGTNIATWKAEGSAGCADFQAVGTDEPTRVRANPLMKKTATQLEVSFDGVFDQLVSPGSGSKLDFIHTAGVFDLLMVFRRRSGGNGRRLFGCSGGAAQNGLQVLQQIDALGPPVTSDGCLSTVIGNNASTLVSFDSTFKTPLGAWCFVLIRGDGTQIRVTRDFYYWVSKAFTGALGTGHAFADYHVGSIADAMVTPNLWEGGMRILSLNSTPLTTSQLIAWKAEAERQVGESL